MMTLHTDWDLKDDVLPQALGPSVMSAVIRSVPEDFQVEEILGFEPSGQGEHLFVEIEKCGANTVWVAQHLARWAGVDERAIGYAGLKDRHALTRQTFTVHLPGKASPEAASLDIEGVRVLAMTRHQRKLARGALKGNRFCLKLRELQGERTAIEARLQQIAQRGVPNVYGNQRFGHARGNLDAARAMFAGRRASRQKRSLYLSAARSELFNRIAHERILRGAWDTALEGEVFMLEGSHSVFGPLPLDEALQQRLRERDIHPTAALWGAGALRSSEAVAEIERAVADVEPELATGLIAAGLKQERRALRVVVAQLQWRWEEDALVLGFELPAGSYATAVLETLGPMQDALHRSMSGASAASDVDEGESE